MFFDWFKKLFYRDLSEKAHTSCPIACPHCEVEICERTMMAIRITLNEEILALGKDNEMAKALVQFRERLIKGSWRNRYDQLADKWTRE